EGRQTRLGRVGRDRVGEVPGRRARHRVETELTRLVDCDRDDAVLERPRRVADRVVLEVELVKTPRLSEIPRAHQGRQAHVVANQRVAGEGEEVAVAPDAGRARRDAVARQDRADRGIVVLDLEWAEALLADVDGALRDAATALAADEPSDMRHEP